MTPIVLSNIITLAFVLFHPLPPVNAHASEQGLAEAGPTRANQEYSISLAWCFNPAPLSLTFSSGIIIAAGASRLFATV